MKPVELSLPMAPILAGFQDGKGGELWFNNRVRLEMVKAGIPVFPHLVTMGVYMGTLTIRPGKGTTVYHWANEPIIKDDEL